MGTNREHGGSCRPCATREVAGGAARLVNPLSEDDIAEAILEVLRVFDSLVGAPVRGRDGRLEPSGDPVI